MRAVAARELLQALRGVDRAHRGAAAVGLLRLPEPEEGPRGGHDVPC